MGTPFSSQPNICRKHFNPHNEVNSCHLFLYHDDPREPRCLQSNGMPKQMMPTKTIAELVVETPCFGTLLAAVQAADLVETLSGEGPFTVFAPNNGAFAKIPTETLDGLLADKEALTGILLRHVVPGAALKALEVPEGTTPLTTAGGEEIEVTRDRYISIKSSAGEAGVVAFDIVASNGVIHMVNSVF